MFQILHFINLHNCTAVLVLSDFRHLQKVSTKARHTTVQIYELMASEPKLAGGGGLIGSTQTSYLVNKPLSVVGISEDNARG